MMVIGQGVCLDLEVAVRRVERALTSRGIALDGASVLTWIRDPSRTAAELFRLALECSLLSAVRFRATHGPAIGVPTIDGATIAGGAVI